MMYDDKYDYDDDNDKSWCIADYDIFILSYNYYPMLFLSISLFSHFGYYFNKCLLIIIIIIIIIIHVRLPFMLLIGQ